jgi:hypothetical protein
MTPHLMPVSQAERLILLDALEFQKAFLQTQLPSNESKTHVQDTVNSMVYVFISSQLKEVEELRNRVQKLYSSGDIPV